jgi:hypothetical protein
MADLITDTELKVYLQIPADEAQHKELLGKLITMGSDFVQKFCGRLFKEEELTETLDGNGLGEILLSEMDVNSITSLTIEGTAILAANFELYSDEGSIKLTDGSVFTSGSHNVVVTYKAGTQEVPEEIKFVLLEICARKFKEIDSSRQGVRSESMGDQSISFSDALLTAEVKGILQRYRKRESV